MTSKPLHIMHITEALGGGVLNVLQQLEESQSSSGHTVTIVHSVRTDTPPAEILHPLFSPAAIFIKLPMVTSMSVTQDTASLWHIVRILRDQKPDIIHLHSSKAGVLGRIAVRLLGKHNQTFYTPHGFAFLRQDISCKKRKVFKFIERICALLGSTTIACSKSEQLHSINNARQTRTILIENSVPTHLIKKSQGHPGPICQVSTSGRLCFPKNPSAFRKLAVSLLDQPAHFKWVGGGELEADLMIDGEHPPNLSVTGWVTRNAVTDHLHRSDLFVMTSLWEGMPLSLLEAQASGLPCVVPNVEGCRDVVIDGVTGFICDTPDTMSEKVRCLIENSKLRETMGVAARETALQRFSPDRMHSEMMMAYRASQPTSS